MRWPEVAGKGWRMKEPAGQRARIGWGVVVLLLLAALLLYRATQQEDGAPQTGDYPFPLPTLLPIPPTLAPPHAGQNSGMGLPEDWLPLYPYDPPAYPQFAALVPADTPCATWENGGLFWMQSGGNPDLPQLPPWTVFVDLERYRFCGVPAPYAEQPEPVPFPTPSAR